jgi:uncharacterized protein (TIGR02186 family)
VVKWTLAAALAMLALAAPASAQQPGDVARDLPSAVVEDSIAVGSDYRGSSITVFGYNPDRRGRGDIVVVVRGPSEPATVLRKRRVFGLWVNGDPVRFSEAPTFFAVLSTRPLSEIASRADIRRYALDPAASAQLASGTPRGSTGADYRAALVRLRRAQNLYQEHVGVSDNETQRAITRYPESLFRAVVRLPANAPIDEYFADTYLFRDGRLISSQRSTVNISRVGIERSIHDLASNAAILYGALVVAMAMSIGWAAAVLFRRP